MKARISKSCAEVLIILACTSWQRVCMSRHGNVRRARKEMWLASLLQRGLLCWSKAVSRNQNRLGVCAETTSQLKLAGNSGLPLEKSFAQPASSTWQMRLLNDLGQQTGVCESLNLRNRLDLARLVEECLLEQRLLMPLWDSNIFERAA